MGSLTFDVRHAVRALLRTPVFTVVTVMTLALGIGANSAIFSLVNAVLIRPLGYAEPDRLMLVYEGIPEADIPRFGVSPPDLQRPGSTPAVVHADWRLPDALDRDVGRTASRSRSRLRK